MRRYLLDTGPLTAYLLGRPAVQSLVEPWITRQEAATSILIYGEVTEYIMSVPDVTLRQAQLRRLLREVSPYVPTYAILERYAELRHRLRPPPGPGLIGDVDTLIAATALERELTLVTMDGDFQRVPGLQLALLPRRG